MLARRAQWALVPFQKCFQKISLKELCFSITHAYVSFTSCGTLLKIFTGHPFIFCCSTYCLPTATKIYLYTFSLLSLTMPFPINMRIVLVNDIDQSKWSCSSVIGIRHACTCWKPSPVLLVYVLCIMVAANGGCWSSLHCVDRRFVRCCVIFLDLTVCFLNWPLTNFKIEWTS